MPFGWWNSFSLHLRHPFHRTTKKCATSKIVTGHGRHPSKGPNGSHNSKLEISEYFRSENMHEKVVYLGGPLGLWFSSDCHPEWLNKVRYYQAKTGRRYLWNYTKQGLQMHENGEIPSRMLPYNSYFCQKQSLAQRNSLRCLLDIVANSQSALHLKSQNRRSTEQPVKLTYWRMKEYYPLYKITIELSV